MSLYIPDPFAQTEKKTTNLNTSIRRCLECPQPTALVSYIGLEVHTACRSIGEAQDKEWTNAAFGLITLGQ